MSVAASQCVPFPEAENSLTGSRNQMRAKWALRKCSQNELRDKIAEELQKTVVEAAQPAEPGEGVKSMLLRAHRNLGRPKFWRVRAAWKGEAGDWSGWAIEDFRTRLNDLRAQRERKRLSESAAMGTRLREMRDGLLRTDPDFFSEQIDALGWALGLGGNADQSEGS